MNTPESPSRRAKFLRILFYVIGLPALVVIFFYAEEDARGKGNWNAFKHKWEAKGENFDRASLIPAPVSDDKNFALAPIVYSSYGNILTRDGKVIPEEKRESNYTNRLKFEWDSLELDSVPTTNAIGDWAKSTLSDLAPWQAYFRHLAATTNLFPVPPEPGAPAKDVLLAVSVYEPVIEELRQASRLPESRFPLEYDADNPADILFPHLAKLKACSLLLEIRAIAELQNRESQKAFDDIKLSLRLIDSIRTEPMLISHLVRVAMAAIIIQPVYEGLTEHKWTDAQLAELDSELAKVDFVTSYQFAMRSEAVFFQQGMFNYVRHHPENLFPVPGVIESGTPLTKTLGHLVPSGWFYQNQTRCARIMFEFYIPAADPKTHTISPALVSAAESALTAETRHLTPYNIIERLLLPAFSNSARRFSRVQGSIDLARAAIDLERFRLATGSYPSSLDDLKSKGLPTPPHDVINGAPLHYSRTNDSFVLYSVGWNETDDGGQVVLRNNGTVDPLLGDWVWKYPSP